MEMSSTRAVPASVEETWRALNDPEFLKDCIPGCESIERVSDTEYKVTMAAKVGPVNARFNGRMTLSDLDPPKSYALVFEGQGGAAGFAKGSAKVNLAPDGAGTAMGYQVSAQVGGKLAQIGSRLVDGAAKKVADDFFAAFVAKIAALHPEAAAAAAEAGAVPAEGGAPGVAGPVAVPGAAPGAPAPGAAPGAPAPEARHRWLPWAIAIIVALILFFAFRG